MKISYKKFGFNYKIYISLPDTKEMPMIQKKKLILHLCADIGSDTRFFAESDEYEVRLIGKDIGVENYRPPADVYGIIANPVCTELSTATGFEKIRDIQTGMFLVDHCFRIIDEAKPTWWALENPANGRLKEIIGKPNYTYQPWQFGSPWTKLTALWTGGAFKMPEPIYKKWEDVPLNPNIYVRAGRKPALVSLHKSALNHISEFEVFRGKVHTDADFRSLCSQGFAKALFESNK